MEKNTETLHIDGMSCNHCIKTVRTALEEIEGVDVEEVVLGSARIQYNQHHIPRTRLKESIEDMGFELRD